MARKLLNLKALKKFCKKEKVKLLKDYTEEKVGINTQIIGECKECKSEFQKSFGRLLNNGGPFCKICTKKRGRDKFKATSLKLFGTENPFQADIIKEKSKMTNVKKRGVEHASQAEEVKEKMKDTIKQKNMENPSRIEEITKKRKATNLKVRNVDNPMKAEDIKEKIRETNQNRRGVDNPMKCEEVKEKGKATNLKKRGVKYASQDEEVKNKIKATVKQRNIDNPEKLEEIKEKREATNRERYGYDYPAQNPEHFHKHFGHKSYETPSGKTIRYQGYENFALDILHTHYNEDDIITDKNIPVVRYELEGSRIYHPDIYIPEENWIIEVKSTHTFKDILEMNMEKAKATIDKGYNYTILIYNEKGHLLKLIGHNPNNIFEEEPGKFVFSNLVGNRDVEQELYE